MPDVTYDVAQGVVRYTLPDAARVNLRVGLGGGGPLLGTIVDWVPRAAGAHEERWNGKDASAVLDLAQHPQRKLYLSAFALPRNTIIVLPETAQRAHAHEVRSAQHREGVVDLARRVIGVQHDVRALERR